MDKDNISNESDSLGKYNDELSISGHGEYINETKHEKSDPGLTLLCVRNFTQAIRHYMKVWTKSVTRNKMNSHVESTYSTLIMKNVNVKLE